MGQFLVPSRATFGMPKYCTDAEAATPKLFLASFFKLCPASHLESSAMLTEHFVASISAHTKPNTGVTKDAGIFFHEYQPLANQRHVFKKSATAPNCLAVSTSHIFAAQADKAVVHVYSREKANQEAIVPFPERIHSIALAANDTVLLLGTASGRILGWEVSCMLLNLYDARISFDCLCRFALAVSCPPPRHISNLSLLSSSTQRPTTFFLDPRTP